MKKPLSSSELRWSCPLDALDFQSTEDLVPLEEIVGQDRAVEALSFGLAFRAPNHHIFVRGQEGTGRLTLVKKHLADPGRLDDTCRDRAYVMDFEAVDRPALLTLPPGRAPVFKAKMATFCAYLTREFVDEVEELVRVNRGPIDTKAQQALNDLTEPFEAKLTEANLVLAQVTDEDGDAETVVLPIIDGKPTPLDDLEEGTLSAEEEEALEAAIEAHTSDLAIMTRSVRSLERTHRAEIQALVQVHARRTLDAEISPLRKGFPRAKRFLKQVVEHVIEHLDVFAEHGEELVRRFEVNVLLSRSANEVRPVIVESAPSVQTLLGTIDLPIEEGTSPHMGIRAGALLRADGGFLVLHARTLLRQEGAWESLARTLRSAEIKLLPDDQPTTLRPPGIKPDPMPIDVKVILLGDYGVYQLLDAGDPDFPELFKVLADFEDTVPNTNASIGFYATVIAGIARRGNLPPFTRGAVAALVEHGARIAAERGQLTARFGRIADIGREAAWLARGAPILRTHVEDAITRGKRRADGPGASFRDRIKSGAVRILTTGTAVGEINGMAVISSGQLTFGMPTRITATAGPGSDGVVNVEQEAALSGQIHVKSFHILMGLVRHLIDADHPLTFSASVAFEQSYGGIDGDSAGGASFCVLLSALTELPIRQDLAMTGAIDQVGNVLPIGAVNEKIEGFFDCIDSQQSHGAVIPAANAGDLMLRQDVVDAGFKVYAVERIEEAVELFFNRPAAEVLDAARARLQGFWKVSDTQQGASSMSRSLKRQLRRVAMRPRER